MFRLGMLRSTRGSIVRFPPRLSITTLTNETKLKSDVEKVPRPFREVFFQLPPRNVFATCIKCKKSEHHRESQNDHTIRWSLFPPLFLPTKSPPPVNESRPCDEIVAQVGELVGSRDNGLLVQPHIQKHTVNSFLSPFVFVFRE